MNHRPIACLALAGLTASVQAQTPSFQYAIQAPASLNPGQSATIRVFCGFTPGVGQPVTGGTVLGLSSGTFNIAGSGVPGTWSSVQNIPPYQFCGVAGCGGGTPFGLNVIGVIWGNGFGPPLGTVSTVNPTPVWQGTFTAGQTPGSVTFTLSPLGVHGIWYMPPGGTISSELTSTKTQGAQVTILIPAPSVLALLALAGLAASRRRIESDPV